MHTFAAGTTSTAATGPPLNLLIGPKRYLTEYMLLLRRTHGHSLRAVALQALIYDKIPSLIPKDIKLKKTLVVVDKYPVIRKKNETWKLELDKLSPKEIKNCDLCSRHHGLLEHGPEGPLFQKACECLVLAHVIGQARNILEGSLEGDCLSEINDFDLVEELKTKYLGVDATSDWVVLIQ